MTERYAVVGDPVAHSLSPLIHTGWMRTARLDALYDRIHLQSPDPANDLRALAKDYSGLNVTLPHKIAALAAAATASREAQTIGAANTLAPDGAGGWIAHNTDVAGFRIALEAAGALRLADLSIVMIGAGGAARAAVFMLAAAGAQIAIVNRTIANADLLARELAPKAQTGDLTQLPALAASADVVVNSASLGHGAGVLPDLPEGKGRPFLDLSYGKAAAGALAAAAAAGWTPFDGIPMLVGQAAAAFRIWFGISPDEASALKACREAIAARG